MKQTSKQNPPTEMPIIKLNSRELIVLDSKFDEPAVSGVLVVVLV